MKKLLSVFLFAVIAVSVFTGCSDNPSGDDSLRARVGDFAIVVDEFKEALLPNYLHFYLSCLSPS